MGDSVYRANKRASVKRVFPSEYFLNKSSADFVRKILSYADRKKADIFSVIFTLAVNLLKEARIYDKKNVAEVLKNYRGTKTVSRLSETAVPSDEFDILGAVYQSYITEGRKNITGSYYTPSIIVHNMTKDFDFSSGQNFLDPCCGSGAFLKSLSIKDPNRIFGIDIDETAVFIAKINLLLKYPDHDFSPEVYCADFLNLNGELPLGKFDYISTNPPWGAMENGAIGTDNIKSGETFSHFFVKSFGMLKEGGVIRFLFPEAILNVKAHKDIREFMLNTAGLIGITGYNGMFSGVTTKYVDIECGKKADKNSFFYCSGGEKKILSVRGAYETDNLNFNILSDDDLTIIDLVKSKGSYSLKNSKWALGIVTGDNKGKLSSVPLKGMEKIYTGKEITPYFLKPARYYILFSRADLQQAAGDDIYRAPEKLVYKFISDTLVFAYDNSGSLFLNSANILIPNVPGMCAKTVLTFLNSSLFRFYYEKLFGDVKVLKGNLIKIPFPKLAFYENIDIGLITNSILKGNISDYEKADDYIFSFYGLTPEQKKYVLSSVKGYKEEGTI